MKAFLTAVGTRGDVAPYTGLATALVAAGHEVRVAAYDTFRDMIEATGAQHVTVPGDPRDAGSWTQIQHGSSIGTGPIGLTRLMRRMTGESVDTARLLRSAAAGSDVLLLAMTTTLGYHVAESLGVPSAGVFLQPAFPTREHPPSLVGTGRSLGPLGNLAAGHAGVAAMGTVFAGAIRAVREELGLPPLAGRRLTRAMQSWPVLHAYSPALLPRPADWRPELDVTGFLWPAEQPGWTPPGELTAFLDDGPAPVFVGFGSRVFPDADRLGDVVGRALELAGVRGVVQSGWSDLDVRSSRVLTVGELPHSWLFPRTAAVVHHAGAGTTAAGLRAGRPTVGVPVISDQPFWAGTVAARGLGPRPVPHRRVTAERLAAAIRDAVERPSYADAAARMAARIGTENGAGTAVARIEELVARFARR